MSAYETNLDTWQEALTRRLRTLLRIGPLQRMEAGKSRRELRLEDQDLRALALRALDATIEHMGLGSGPSYEQLRDTLRPLVHACDDQATQKEVDSVIRLVVDGLLNERERRRAFHETYLSIESNQIVRRYLDFHLLQEHSAADGSIVLKATTEAINLYAGMLEYPVEDAQIAEEAVLRSQVNRGRISDAVQTAKRARLRSIEYEQKILGYLETTRRDVTQIDWVRDVLALIRSAREHIGDRIHTEGDLVCIIEKRIESVTTGGEAGPQLAALRDVLRECVTRHLRLQQRLIGANQEYLDEQDRQAFRPRALAPLPDLEAQVLHDALALPSGVVSDHIYWLLARFQAPRTRPVVHLSSLVDRLLMPRRADEDGPVEVNQADLEPFEAMPPRFSTRDHQEVNQIFANLPETKVLSALLCELRDRSVSDSVLKLVVLRALLAYDAAVADSTSFQVRVESQGGALREPLFFGDDLRLMKPRMKPRHSPPVEDSLRPASRAAPHKRPFASEVLHAH